MDLMAEFIQTEFIDKAEKRAPVAPMYDLDLDDHLVERICGYNPKYIAVRVLYDTDEDIDEEWGQKVTVPTLRRIDVLRRSNLKFWSFESDELSKDVQESLREWLEEMIEAGQ